MPARSKSERRLMAAAEHGAAFGLAKQLRERLTTQQLHDFAATPGLPERVPTPRATPKAAPAHPGGNLGQYLHPRKGGR